MDNINVKFYTTCATLQKADGYSCLCVHVTTSGIWRDRLEGYNDLDVQTYDENYLTYQITPKNPPVNIDTFNKCFIGIDCSDITDKCEYINGNCRAKCSNHLSQYECENDNSCRVDTQQLNSCTNSSLFPVFKLISFI